jgi:hypothetical protein
MSPNEDRDVRAARSLLPQVGVGDAGLGAVAERVDGGGQQAGVGVDGAWVGVQ